MKDEVALSKEKFRKIDLVPIVQSVVDDYNNLYQTKRGIKITFFNDGNKSYLINGIENRIEQIVANLLDNAISFSGDNKDVTVQVSKSHDEKVYIKVLDEGQGFKEKDTIEWRRQSDEKRIMAYRENAISKIEEFAKKLICGLESFANQFDLLGPTKNINAASAQLAIENIFVHADKKAKKE